MLSFTPRDDVDGAGKDTEREKLTSQILKYVFLLNIFVVTCLKDVSRVTLQPTAMVKCLQLNEGSKAWDK